MSAGPPLGSSRQDILREPWFLGTLLGCIGGLLWLVFCIISIWLYRRRKAVTGRKLKNMAAYSGKYYSGIKNLLCCHYRGKILGKIEEGVIGFLPQTNLILL